MKKRDICEAEHSIKIMKNFHLRMIPLLELDRLSGNGVYQQVNLRSGDKTYYRYRSTLSETLNIAVSNSTVRRKHRTAEITSLVPCPLTDLF